MPASHAIVGAMLMLMGGTETLQVVAHVTGVLHDSSFKSGLEIPYLFAGASLLWLGATLQRGWKGFGVRFTLLIRTNLAFLYSWIFLLTFRRA